MSSERPFEIQRIDHVVLRVQDLPRAVRFTATSWAARLPASGPRWAWCICMPVSR